MKRTSLLLLAMLSFMPMLFAQQKADTITLALVHSPTKASIMSALIPGLGQAYNKQSLKIPFLYAGFGALGYFIITNNREYQKYRTAFEYRTDNNDNTIDDKFPQYDLEQIRKAKDDYKGNIELLVLSTIGLYALNVIDASVYAHLYKFSVTEDLSLRIEPQLMSSPLSYRYNPGVRLTLRF